MSYLTAGVTAAEHGGRSAIMRERRLGDDGSSFLNCERSKSLRTRACSVVVLLLTVRCGSVEAVEPQAEPRPEHSWFCRNQRLRNNRQSTATGCPRQQAAAERLGIPVVTTNSIGMKLVLIPAGEFMMGGHESARGSGRRLSPPTSGSQSTSRTNIRGIACGSPSRSISASTR